MKKHKITRNAASEAVIALRTTLGMTQAQFAVQVMDSAVTTVARWETSHAPQGELLLRLGDIAQRNGVKALRDVFRELYVKEVLAKLGFDLMIVPKTEKEVEHGYLMFRLEGIEEIRAAQRLTDIIQRRRSPDPESRKTGEAELASLIEPGTGEPSVADQIRAAFIPHIVTGTQVSTKQNHGQPQAPSAGKKRAVDGKRPGPGGRIRPAAR